MALLASKRAIDAKKVSNREELFRSNVVREKQDLHEKVAYVFSMMHMRLKIEFGLVVRMR